MRILFLGNNWVAWQTIQWLKSQGEDIVGLVIHPPETRKYGKEIVKSSKVDSARVFDGSQLRKPETLQAIKTLRPDMGVSAFFGYILTPEFLDILSAGCVNIHPALLPYNRGAYPNVWSIVEGTPAGVTLHYIDEGIDTGDIIAQHEVSVEPIDTGESLYRKLEHACVDLFRATWPLLRAGQASRKPQLLQAGTYHNTNEVIHIDEIDLDRRYTARELIDVLRARTFPPHSGAFFRHQGRRITMRLHLEYEDS
ncbi:MAG: methionyl-tRNA formyltransferase [Candidatus Hodarchaeota archaeon]